MKKFMINWCHVYKRHFQILKLDPQDEATQMGSQTGKDQLDKIQSYIDAAKRIRCTKFSQAVIV